MKITTINPLIVSKDAENIIKLFEALGFEKQHSITFAEDTTDITSVRMKNADGFAVDVALADDLQRDLSLIRMNVDDFDEAYQMLLDRGFKNPRGVEHEVDTPTNKSAMMISPSGFAFDVCQHIKE